MSNVDAAAQADLVVLSVPYSAHQTILESVKEVVQGKILVDVTVPLKPPNVRTVYVPEGQSGQSSRRRPCWVMACAWWRRFRMSARRICKNLEHIVEL